MSHAKIAKGAKNLPEFAPLTQNYSADQPERFRSGCSVVPMRPAEPLRSLVRQAKPGRSCDLKGGHHGNCPLTCSQASRRRSNPAGEASPGEGVSRSASEPDSASLRSVRVARLPDWLKPAPATKQRADAVVGLSGVGGDGARRQIGRGTWETRPSGGAPPNAGRESITSHAAGAGSRSGPECAPGSGVLRGVKVPLALGWRAPYPKAGVMPRWPRPRRLGRAGCPPRGGIRRACGEAPGRNRWGRPQG